MTGIQATSCPETYLKNRFRILLWNTPMYFYNLFWILTAISEITWVIFFSDTKLELAECFIVCLLMTCRFFVSKHRNKIHMLLEKLAELSKILRSSLNRKRLYILIVLCNLLMIGVAFILGIAFISFSFKYHVSSTISDSTFTADKLKRYFITSRKWILGLTTIQTYVIAICVTNYYCFVCYCIKLFCSEFVQKSRTLMKQQGYQTILHVYQKITTAIAFADDFLSYPVFIIVLSSMVGLFWSTYSFVFVPRDDSMICICFLSGIVYYSASLLIVMLTGAVANQAVVFARETVISLPGWIRQHYKELKMDIRQRFKHKTHFTLWNIYIIDKSLLISALGTLVTYGILIGTLGSVQGKIESII
ncbi:uncharacterized protein TNIN_466191 [Trichonephila inaurata madagascariensis]|uniref:Uncharacterized protein n=1 Tax=Trichonephila inaurata madagascariensis TaxID=2747483 RepID=A0A8X7CLC4_9ARAC|nr:uncharacterized protein TNIN_466191 [Trichonephila inaurata madagascariensis]